MRHHHHQYFIEQLQNGGDDTPKSSKTYHAKFDNHAASSSGDNNPYRPVIQFGGTQTDKEVQYVLNTLSESKRRKYRLDEQHHSLHSSHQYSNTAPSTPNKVTVKRFKRDKSKRKRDKH